MEVTKHEPSGQILAQPLLQPHVDRFSDVFWQASFDKDNKPEPRVIQSLENTRVGPYCQALGVNGPSWVSCADWVLSRLAETLVVPDESGLFFELVPRGDWTLVVAKYNQIIGSRWLAMIKTDSIPTQD